MPCSEGFELVGVSVMWAHLLPSSIMG